jgi:hypothetical protein
MAPTTTLERQRTVVPSRSRGGPSRHRVGRAWLPLPRHHWHADLSPGSSDLPLVADMLRTLAALPAPEGVLLRTMPDRLLTADPKPWKLEVFDAANRWAQHRGVSTSRAHPVRSAAADVATAAWLRRYEPR